MFLSFRGNDIRRGFLSHLHHALSGAGIQTFIDDEELERGDLISEQLMRAIELSRGTIIIFSENYASSTWCLTEIVKIMECHNTMDHWTIPVFYGVDPSDVRHQRSIFGEALKRPSRRIPEERVRRCRESLTQAANLSGFHSANFKGRGQL